MDRIVLKQKEPNFIFTRVELLQIRVKGIAGYKMLDKKKGKPLASLFL